MSKILLFIISFFFYTGSFFIIPASAQETIQVKSPEALPYHSIDLSNFKAFKAVKKKQWQLAGNVFADRRKEKHLAMEKGTGILVSKPQSKAAPLATELQHGDLDLELDFLMAKGASAAIALQGRYLVNLSDSWLQNNLSLTATGGISSGTTGFAPTSNASKAPGLWQHLKISFIAPRFNTAGQKTTSARLVEVSLNGKKIQQPVTITAPSGNAPIPGESAAGPLMLVGGSGPVAFKNIQYKTYAEQRLLVHTLQYKLHKGRFRQLDKLPTSAPFKTGTSDSISFRLGGEDELLTLEGELEAPRTGDYLFRLSAGGPAWIYLDNKLVVDNKGSRDYQRFFYGGTSLSQGKHPFKIIYSNHDESLVLHYEGPEIPWTSLTTPASTRRVKGQEPLIYAVKEKPAMQRGFMLQQQGTSAYAVAVGIPGGVNYAYDLNAYAPLSVWHGNYLDVANMWRERGEKQLAEPIGPELTLSGLPTITTLKAKEAAWPDTIHPDTSPYTNKGYKLNTSGLPIFFYSFHNVGIEDYFSPTTGQAGLTRELNLQVPATKEPLYLLLASSHDIQKLPNGSYGIGNKNYYIEDIQAGDLQPIIRKSNGQTQLLLPLPTQSTRTQIKYSIIW